MTLSEIPMGNRFRLIALVLIACGLAGSILSGTDICTFVSCTEAHK
jgi:hypothetical protein